VADETAPLTQVYTAYEQLEGKLSSALDRLVATNAFADLLATSATNVMAATRLANGTVDRAVRSTRLAARSDVVALSRQLTRTEDKLERLLQLLEEFGDRIDRLETPAASGAQEPVEPQGEAAAVPSANGKPAPAARARTAKTTRPARSTP